MSPAGVRARLQQATRRAVRRYAAVQVMVEGLIDTPLEPGELFVLHATAAFDVEWAVVARHPAHSRLLLVMPADGCSLVGSSDVEIPESAPGGPLVLRCRFGQWLGDSSFETRTRVGVLDPGDVARARLAWSEIEKGDEPGPARWEADEGPDYQDWVTEILVPACMALADSEET